MKDMSLFNIRGGKAPIQLYFFLNRILSDQRPKGYLMTSKK
jgi:hypothetical protein